MARSRNIKPGLFKNELLGEADPHITVLFSGLWCLADKEGRLEDRPKRIKAEIMPYRCTDVEPMLEWLSDNGFIKRYAVAGERYIEVANWKKHQTPHHKEADSEIPPPNHKDAVASVKLEPSMEQASGKQIASCPTDSLIPDSLNLIPDSGFSDSLPPSGGDSLESSLRETPTGLAPPAKPLKGPDPIARETWSAYASSYEARYKTPPVRNAKANGQIVQLVKRLGAEAPRVAEFFLTHNEQFYVKRMHDLGLLLNDAEKLRTEWATGSRMTATRARQVDSTQSNMDAAQQAKELLRQRGANV